MRLSLGKLLVNLSQLVKRTNTPLIPQHIHSALVHYQLRSPEKSYIYTFFQGGEAKSAMYPYCSTPLFGGGRGSSYRKGYTFQAQHFFSFYLL